MKLEELTKALQENLGSSLEAVVLYGSAVGGDHAGKNSDYNVMAVVSDFSVEKLRTLSKTVQKWVKAKNPPPLLFTEERLHASTDIFPIELLDIKENHRLLFGRDCLHDLEIKTTHLRLELERELHSKMIQLREDYLIDAQRDRDVRQILLQSISSILVLCRAALRLWTNEVPSHKLEATRKLADYIAFDVTLFESLFELKQTGKLAQNPHDVFQRYLNALTLIVDAVDKRSAE